MLLSRTNHVESYSYVSQGCIKSNSSSYLNNIVEHVISASYSFTCNVKSTAHTNIRSYNNPILPFTLLSPFVLCSGVANDSDICPGNEYCDHNGDQRPEIYDKIFDSIGAILSNLTFDFGVGIGIEASISVMDIEGGLGFHWDVFHAKYDKHNGWRFGYELSGTADFLLWEAEETEFLPYSQDEPNEIDLVGINEFFFDGSTFELIDLEAYPGIGGNINFSYDVDAIKEELDKIWG